MARSLCAVPSAPWRQNASRCLLRVQPWLSSKGTSIPRTSRRLETISYNALLVIRSSFFSSDPVGLAPLQEGPCISAFFFLCFIQRGNVAHMSIPPLYGRRHTSSGRFHSVWDSLVAKLLLRLDGCKAQ